MSIVLNVIQCKCPNCKKGKMFSNRGNILLFKIPEMKTKCEACYFKFEKEPGFFFGAMFVSYALAVGQMIISLVIFWQIIDFSPLKVFLIIALIALLLSTLNYKIARSIWVHLFYKKPLKSTINKLD
mgnify:FL=1